jgi:putative ATP-binding cassette transporter
MERALTALPSGAAGGDAAAPAPRTADALAQLGRLAAPYWNGPERWTARGLAGGLALLTGLLVLIQLRVNEWNGDLFDALEARDADGLLRQVGIFAVLVAAGAAATGAHLAVKRRLQIGWRRCLTERLASEWMAEGRPYQIAQLEGGTRNADARIAEDVRLVTEGAVELANSLAYCLLLVFAFAGVLWSLSGIVRVPVPGVGEVPVPGHMVVLALLYAGAGTLAAYLLGRPLVRIADERQSREADFRLSMARAQDHAESIALAGGEAAERSRFAVLFAAIGLTWGRQTRRLSALIMFGAGFNTVAAVFPILAGAPRYFADAITLGTLMQAAQAFGQVVSALSWPVGNSAALADARASIARVIALEDAADAVRADSAGGAARAVQVERWADDRLAFDGLRLAEPDGRLLLDGLTTEVRRGERVSVDGDARAGFALFMAAAGLWPWGTGRILLPAGGAVVFLSQKPYLPPGRLRAVLAYPDDPDGADGTRLAEALERVGLGRLAGRLDEELDADRELGTGERQRLGLARLVVRRPAWVLMENPCDALPPAEERAVMGAVLAALPGTAAVLFGDQPSLDGFFPRRLDLERAAAGRLFTRDGTG